MPITALPTFLVFLTTGLFAGILAGLFGVGGGLVIVPALVLLLGFSQQTAIATSLIALLAPVGLGGVYAFYKAGKIDATQVKAGLLISAGMFFGSYLGSKITLSFSEATLKKVFSVFLLIVAAKVWLSALAAK